MENPDKGCIAVAAAAARVAQFTSSPSSAPIVLTRAPLYVHKARLLPGTTFVVGADPPLRLPSSPLSAQQVSLAPPASLCDSLQTTPGCTLSPYSTERERAPFAADALLTALTPTTATDTAGMDTAERLVMPKYYGGTVEGMVAALTEIQQLHCEFLVAGRQVRQVE